MVQAEEWRRLGQEAAGQSQFKKPLEARVRPSVLKHWKDQAGF